MPGPAASDGPTVSLSFANNFWGKDDAGVTPLLERMHNSKTTSDELKAFYAARASIEEDYAKKLLSLARKPLGSSEAGTLRMSMDVVRGEVESMGKEHQNVATKMKSELDEPLAAFSGGLKERRKIVQNGIEKLHKTKMQQTGVVNKTRDRYEQDCLKIKGYLAQGHMVMGQEERKNKQKLEKTQIQMSANSNEYEAAVKILEETTGRWNREWKAACDKFQDLEEERIDYFKSSLWNFANIASTVCVSDDASCEKIRLSLEDCDVEKDISSFIQESGTGQEIPDPPKYINFCRGDVDDMMSRAESDDGDYSVAQFQRTMNPTYRSSSPQPSTYESHHDPESSLREEMGMPKARSSFQSSLQGGRNSMQSGRPSLQGDDSFNARSSHGSAVAPPPLNPSQTSAPMDPYGNAPQIPHNPYPTDGMTQFCRYGATSERSSNPSPTRPESRDSQDHSDYSAPTSFSSFEPTSGNASPTKQYNGSAMSGMSGVSSGPEDTGPPKKKGGFFNSPFRKRSQKKAEAPPHVGAIPPAQRKTWAPATMPDNSANTAAPVKPQFGANNRANTWQAKQPSPSPEPEPTAAEPGYQLGIGGNVFDVSSPDKRGRPSPKKDDVDPIAQALAELKGVTKQASVRQSADKHYGMSTPAPGTVPAPFANNGNRNTPPPAYDMPPVSRLGAPQPAHTSRDMQKTTERFVAQKRDMFNSPSRPGSSMGRSQPPPRAASPQPARAPSPQPARAASPNPFMRQGAPPQQQPYRAASPNPYGAPPQANRPRAASPNPYGAPPQANRARAQSSSPIKPQPNYGGYNSRGGSPGYAGPRAASPNPAYQRPPSNAGMRPPSSRGGSDLGSPGAMVLAPAGGQDPYAAPPQQRRPQSQYYPQESPYGSQQLAPRPRSQSIAGNRQVTKDGRPILHFSRAMYMYAAAIPEELSFAKGDILAVTRHQDDGWWEAEVCTKPGVVGLVPSNYLKNC
ncbi:hypothetical protein KC345_g5843 [Hortaea werneckii]|nr:hypothetical protein KC345_g5843 [Hortaea werneckii]